MREVADYAPDMKISIEYKPFEERNFALMDTSQLRRRVFAKIEARPALSLKGEHSICTPSGPIYPANPKLHS